MHDPPSPLAPIAPAAQSSQRMKVLVQGTWRDRRCPFFPGNADGAREGLRSHCGGPRRPLRRPCSQTSRTVTAERSARIGTDDEAFRSQYST